MLVKEILIFATLAATSINGLLNGPINALCQSEVIKMKEDFRKILIDELIPQAVRTVSHDCLGGCDGCMNYESLFSGGGFLNAAKIFNTMYDSSPYKSKLSRADFYVLAGIVALENGIKNANRGVTNPFELIPYIPFDFKYGRQDCDTSPFASYNRPFVDTLDYDGLLNYFSKHFGLKEIETIALMGAHTLGRATGSSGFLGYWKENKTESFKFDNRYYKKLMDPTLTWYLVDKSNATKFPYGPRWQWEAFNETYGKESFMLGVDVALVIDIKLDSKGKSSCDFDTCDKSPGAKITKKFANRSFEWMKNFAVAWDKMTSKGATNLKRPLWC